MSTAVRSLSRSRRAWSARSSGWACFWGAERLFWQLPGVYTTAVGYAGGLTPNPTYEEVCSSRTGHNEVVRVLFDPAEISYAELLRTFWEGHDPTQGMRQGNDVGTQYRSGIYVYSAAQRAAAEQSRADYQEALTAAGYGPITTEILDAARVLLRGALPPAVPWRRIPTATVASAATGVGCAVGVAGATSAVGRD